MDVVDFVDVDADGVVVVDVVVVVEEEEMLLFILLFDEEDVDEAVAITDGATVGDFTFLNEDGDCTERER